MGKRNRMKNKKRKLFISNLTIIAEVIPSFLHFYTPKEHFVDRVKKIYSKHLKDFTEIIQTRIESRSCVQLKYSKTAKPAVNQHPSIQDPANEYFHIFSLQLNRFLNSIVILIREIETKVPKLFELTIEDAYHIIESTSYDISNISNYSFNGFDINYEAISLSLFKEKLYSDTNFKKYMIKLTENLSEENNHSDDLNKPEKNEEIMKILEKPAKPKKKRKEKPDNPELDKEIEDFKFKLDTESIPFSKIKPNFSEAWIAGLRKRLKDRVY